MFLLHRGDAAVLVDSGSPPDRPKLEEALAASGFAPPKLKAVIVTHAHADHAGCAAWLKSRGVAVVLGAGDVPTAANGRNEPLRPTDLMGAALATLFMFPFASFAPDVVVDKDIDLGAYGFPELRVAPATGHTAGSIVVTANGVAFTGDMIKGGEVFTRSPTEHIYQTDRLADHRALAAVLDGGARTLYLGHSGPLAAGDVRSWLKGAEGESGKNAFSLDVDARGESSDGDLGVSLGMRTRLVFGRALGYTAGLDARVGISTPASYELDVHPLGLALRGAGGAMLALTGGAGLGGPRSNGATHGFAALTAEVPAGPLRLLARAQLGWRLSGPAYADDIGIGDELIATAGLRLGRDRRWGAYLAGKGPALLVTYRDFGGVRMTGIALALDVFAGR
jgi:glyoxylase-like metal-dependent hydrolase (beta-lactamase superfamily II)